MDLTAVHVKLNWIATSLYCTRQLRAFHEEAYIIHSILSIILSFVVVTKIPVYACVGGFYIATKMSFLCIMMN